MDEHEYDLLTQAGSCLQPAASSRLGLGTGALDCKPQRGSGAAGRGIADCAGLYNQGGCQRGAERRGRCIWRPESPGRAGGIDAGGQTDRDPWIQADGSNRAQQTRRRTCGEGGRLLGLDLLHTRCGRLCMRSCDVRPPAKFFVRAKGSCSIGWYF